MEYDSNMFKMHLSHYVQNSQEDSDDDDILNEGNRTLSALK